MALLRDQIGVIPGFGEADPFSGMQHQVSAVLPGDLSPFPAEHPAMHVPAQELVSDAVFIVLLDWKLIEHGGASICWGVAQ